MSSPDKYVQQTVQETPAVDVHSHQGTSGIWQARSLWEILSYHWLGVDLRCAGAPREAFTSTDMDPRERVRLVAPYCKLARNTVNHWCFLNVAHDLYGLQDPYLDENNWDWLCDAVDEKLGDAQWEEHVLNQAGVELASAQYAYPPRLGERYFMYEYGEYLFCPAMQADTNACLARLGRPADTPEALAEAIRGHLEALVAEHHIRALHVWVPVSWTYTHTEAGPAGALLHKTLASAHLTPEEQDRLVSFTADVVAAECGRLGLVVQLFNGSVQLEEGGPYVATYRPEWLRALVPYFSRHAETQFDLFLATRLLSHEATVLARNYPNLWVSGAWWQGFTPSTLSEFFRDRLEMLPLNKWNAFYSDAYCVEWLYGKSTLTRNRLAVALAGVLEEGLIGRDTVSDMASAVLRDNPRRLYGL